MGTCCGLKQQFDSRTAKRDLRRYRRRGPTRPTELLLDAIRGEGVTGATVLDIGGGVGTIQHELLASGASRSIAVDVSEPYLDAARSEAERRGTSHRMSFIAGDFVAVAHRTPSADIVTLDRVICCYPDVESLVANSVARANHLFGLVFPWSGRVARVGARMANAFMSLRRSDFRVYIHPTTLVERLVRSHGFERCFRGGTIAWQVFLYRRKESTPA